MDVNGAAATRRARGRIVMLVDNGVRGDSRVQKTARSAAEAGWEVILLGRQTDPAESSFRLGDAEVRLLPVPTDVNYPSLFRRRSLRRPLAYPAGSRHLNYRLASVQAWRADLVARSAALRTGSTGGLAGLVGRGRIAVGRAAATLLDKWVRFRARETRRLREVRQSPDSLLNRIPVAFWTTVMGDRSWRRLDPSLWSWELAYGRVIDQLEPDLIHAHDVKMIGVGARAALRARARGRPVRFVWDAHEYVPGLRPLAAWWLPAQVAHEREYARYADAVVTVSTALADLLRADHKLPEQPTVVMNAPVTRLSEEELAAPVPDLRALCGIDRDTPLLAYSGGINPVRGVDLVVEALPSLPGVHVAMLSLHPSGRNKPADELYERAERLGVADRVHLLPYVPHWQVSRVLAAADAAVSPLHHLPNHEIALSNKFFEYSHARLPLVVSDVRTMSEVVRSTGQGEVFRAQDLADFVRAVKLVLADPERYRAAYDRPGLLEEWSWEAQAEILDRLYARLLPQAPPRQHPGVGDPGSAVSGPAMAATGA
ncbi:glycosyltransferase family 4 protein [Micromonospora sp. HM5-17]|uniref:glycosyltransferase family 4 protein n=1 Tax=Micromonospora sp. HM5-17 TaxID=2487710 RepID=UPI0018F75BD9|nr:glycosyltransferase family 4 protein [Micromonospora sp. HM5-17]